MIDDVVTPVELHPTAPDLHPIAPNYYPTLDG